MDRIFVPAKDENCWRNRLVQPDKHWKDGYSAKMLAEEWQKANGFPPKVAAVLATAPLPFPSLTPLLILPEHKVGLPGGTTPSQNDIWVLASHTYGLASITVEGKVSESFGERLREWLVDAGEGRQERLAFLIKLLGLNAPLPDTIRYQLVHRAASAVLEAKRFHANIALCLIHSFSDGNIGWADFEAFCGLFGKSVKQGEVVHLGQHGAIQIHAGWVKG